MPETVSAIGFWTLSLLCVGGAVGMLTTRNVVHAAFWLLEVSVAVAGVFYLLGADYLALVQLLVYAGAVAVLMIFTIMLTLRSRQDAIRPREFSAPAAALSAVLLATLTLAVLRFDYTTAPMPKVIPGVAAFGKVLFSPQGWALHFELASLVLLVALIGAVWWSREEK